MNPLHEQFVAETRELVHQASDDLIALERDGFSAERIRAWVRDDFRIEAYLQQRFAADERRQDLIADWVSDLRRRAPVTLFEP